MSRRTRGLAVALALSGTFAWGYFSHRNQIFPYWLARTLVERLGPPFRSDPPLSRQNVAVSAADASRLVALGYAESSLDPSGAIQGVLRHDVGRAWPGLTLHHSRRETSAQLIDMDGNVVHRWSHPTPDTWQLAHLRPNGDLLVLVRDVGLYQLDSDSNLKWEYEGPVHHAVTSLDDGIIVTLEREPRLTEWGTVLEEHVRYLSPGGDPISRFSLTEVVQSSAFGYLMPNPGAHGVHGDLESGHLDLLHPNSLQVLDGSLEARSPLFRAGNLLVSLRNISTIAIIDPAARDVVWVWGPGNLTHQHDATLLRSGTILVFDNGTSASSVLEIDPLTRAVVWRYHPGESFFSHFRGAAQRLPNGNTLITVSDRGYAREVTPRGDVVWRFANPDVEPNGSRGALYRVRRFDPGLLSFLATSAADVAPAS